MAAEENGTKSNKSLLDTEKKELIEGLKMCPSLWNTSLDIYKNKAKKAGDSRALATRFNMSMEELKKQFHSLRTSMTREVKRMQADDKYVCKWKFYKDLEFLKDEIVKSLSDKDDKEWEEEEVETLIDFYKDNDNLWNHHLEEYRDRNLRDVLLNKLAEMLGNRTQEDIKNQWHSLKTIFDRESKRVEGSKRTGTGTDSVYKPAWKYYERMMFTKECKDIDDSVSTLTNTADETEENLQPSIKKRKQEKSDKIQEMADTKMELWRHAINVLKTPEHEDSRPGLKEINAISQLVQETLAKFNDMQRTVAKKRINDVLFEVEVGVNSNGTGVSTYGYPGSAYFQSQPPLYQQPTPARPYSMSRSSSPASSVSSYPPHTSFLSDLEMSDNDVAGL